MKNLMRVPLIAVMIGIAGASSYADAAVKRVPGQLKVVLTAPDGKKSVFTGTKEELWKRADDFIDKSDYSYARDIYFQIIEKEPSDIRTNILLGQLYQYKYGKHAEAVKYYKRAERLVPASNSQGKAFTQRLTAEVYRELAEKTNSLIYFVQAISEYEKILDVDPDNLEVRYYLASCRLNSKDYASAIVLFKEIIDRDPNGEWAVTSKKAIRVAEQESKKRV